MWRGDPLRKASVLQSNLARSVVGALVRRPGGPVRRGGAVDIDPALGPAVRDAFYLAARRGSSVRRVAAELAGRGVLSRSGQPLSASTLRELLRNPFYLGMVRFKGQLTEGRHAALVCPSVFERAGRALRKRRCR